MHERSLVKALLRQVEVLAAEYPESRIRSIRVRIGEFAGVEPELFASAFQDIVMHSPFGSVDLDLMRVPLTGDCDQCGNHFGIEGFRFRCDRCGSMKVTLRGGEEMLLESVTMEEAER